MTDMTDTATEAPAPPPRERRQYRVANRERRNEGYNIELEDGQEFPVYPFRISGLTQFDVWGMAHSGDSEAIARLFREAMGEDVFDKFDRAVRDLGYGTDELTQMMADMTEFVTGRPTKRPGS